MVSSPHDAGLPAAWVLPNGSPRWARSRGVDGYFRVFTTSGSGSWVRRASSDLSPLDVVPAVFPEGRLFRGLRHETVRSPRTPGDSPLELHLSLRVGPSARPPPNALLPEGNTRPARAPLMRFPAPSAHVVDASTLRRPTPRCLRAEAPGFACPVRSALAVSHDLDGLLRIRPLQVSPDGAHGVLFLQGLSRSRIGRLVTERAVPSCRSAAAASPPDLHPTAALDCRRLQGLCPRTDRHRSPPVSRRRGLVPLMEFSVGPRTNRPEGWMAVRPRHVFGCQ